LIIQSANKTKILCIEQMYLIVVFTFFPARIFTFWSLSIPFVGGYQLLLYNCRKQILLGACEQTSGSTVKDFFWSKYKQCCGGGRTNLLKNIFLFFFYNFFYLHIWKRGPPAQYFFRESKLV
jgi:hypothetical protein